MADDSRSDVEISKDAFLDLRNVALGCLELLRDLSTTRSSAKAREQMARFNILAANMNIYAEGVQALGFKLKDAPDISRLLKSLLEALRSDLELEKHLLILDEQTDAGSSGVDYGPSDTLSETSSTSSTSTYRLLPPDEKDSHVYPDSKSWNSIQTTIISLSNLATLIYQSGNSHRKKRVEPFMNLDGNETVYRMIESYAREKLVHNFPLARETLCERLAKSIANRRARFSYLGQHHQKLSKVRQPASEGQVKSKVATTSISKPDHHLAEEQTFSVAVTPVPNPQPSLILSNTVNTKIDITGAQDTRIGRAESVASVQVAVDKFPTEAKLDSTGTSFTCQYCYRKCPVTESKGIPYQQHLIQDFEPFVCVFEACTNAFSCAGSYSGWIAHMSEQHSKVQWHCWECEKLTSRSHCFSTSAELEQHMKDRHAETVPDSLRPTALEHSMLHDRQIFQECPFCGGLPIELEKQYPNQKDWKACDALQTHVRNHLISVASILLPIDMGQPDDDLGNEEVKDDRSDAQSGDHSQLGPEEPFTSPILYCDRDSCDCKKQNSISDWSSLETTCQLMTDHRNEILPKVHDDPIYSLDKNTEFEWEFWWPISLPPDHRLTGLNAYPGHSKDDRLLELFGIRPSSITVQGRIVVAVDFGTTHSGLAWAHTDKPEQRYVVDTWPDSPKKHHKVPTTLLYDTENASQYRWGYQIKETERKHQYFKLGLEVRGNFEYLRDLPSAFSLPPEDVTTVKLVTDYLTALRMHMDNILEDQLSRDVARGTPKEYILTVPELWSFKVRAELLGYATAAGMGSKENIHMITETEAAALGVLEDPKESEKYRFRIGDTFVVCHAGAGMVDVNSYTVENLKPMLTVREATSLSHARGSNFLNQEIAMHLQQRLWSRDSVIDEMVLGATEEFERIIGPRFDGDIGYNYSYPTSVFIDDSSKRMDDEESTLRSGDIRGIFDSVVQLIITLVQHHVHQERKKVGPENAKVVFLTGGFGGNLFLNRLLPKALPPDIWIEQSTKRLTDALEGALIARMSAILPAYTPARVDSRFARRHIGFGYYVRYQEGLHDPSQRKQDPISLNDSVSVMQWLIRKGELIKESDSKRVYFHHYWKKSRGAEEAHTLLYSCDKDEAPLHPDSNVQEFAKLRVNLGLVPESELDQQVGVDGEIYYEMSYQIELTFSSTEIAYTLVFKGKKYDAIEVEYL